MAWRSFTSLPLLRQPLSDPGMADRARMTTVFSVEAMVAREVGHGLELERQAEP